MTSIEEIAAYHDSLAIHDASITINLSAVLLAEIVKIAKNEGLELDTWVRMTLEETVAKAKTT